MLLTKLDHKKARIINYILILTKHSYHRLIEGGCVIYMFITEVINISVSDASVHIYIN